MEINYITSQLLQNILTFSALLTDVPKDMPLWRPTPDKWCLLEIVCHLYDEERLDFRTRVSHILDNPAEPLPAINPTAWVKDRKYINQDYELALQNFLAERENSITWLQELHGVNWQNKHNHPTLGPMTAYQFLTNWLAHDYLHFRQITKLKYDYLQHISGLDITYAGNW